MSKMEFSDEFDFENRITDTSEIPEDTAESDNPLRPKTLSEYIGQEKAKEILLEKEIEILVALNDGDFDATAWGCDLTYEYVKINGDYRS